MDYRQNSFGDLNMPQDKRSGAMTTAALILSVAAISTACCFYISFVCGFLGIIFALLSKGGELTMSANARTALWVSVSAIVLTVLIVGMSFLTLIVHYGSLEAFWNAYLEMAEQIAK